VQIALKFKLFNIRVSLAQASSMVFRRLQAKILYAVDFAGVPGERSSILAE
jgi:hypothetical protein